MDRLTVPTSPSPSVLHPGTASNTTELWEVVLVASCPIIFIIFLCLCVVCLIVKSYQRPTVPTIQSCRQASTSQIASILRQLPPPPKYDIAVSSVDAPPPLYADIGKDMAPVRTTPSGARPLQTRHFNNQHHMLTPMVQPLNIQYLYPPKYETRDPNNSTTAPTKPNQRVEHIVVEMEASTSR